MIDSAAFCIGRCMFGILFHQITFAMEIVFVLGLSDKLGSEKLKELVKVAPFSSILLEVNSQNTKPGLLVSNASGSSSHTLNGLGQKVNCEA